MISVGTTFRPPRCHGSHAASTEGHFHLLELRRGAQKNRPHRELGCPCADTKRSSSQPLGNKVVHGQCPAILAPCRSASPGHWETSFLRFGTLLGHSGQQ